MRHEALALFGRNERGQWRYTQEEINALDTLVKMCKSDGADRVEVGDPRFRAYCYEHLAALVGKMTIMAPVILVLYDLREKVPKAAIA